MQQAPDDIRWTFGQSEFDDLFALKKDSAPGPDGIPYGAYRCAGGLGSKFFFRAHHAVLEGSTIPDCFAESRAVPIFSPYFAICRGLHWNTLRCTHPSEMHLMWANDRQHL